MKECEKRKSHISRKLCIYITLPSASQQKVYILIKVTFAINAPLSALTYYEIRKQPINFANDFTNASTPRPMAESCEYGMDLTFSRTCLMYSVNPLNADLNSIFHLLALLGACHIIHVSRIRVN